MIDSGTRSQLANFCESRTRRVAIEFPCQWAPGSVVNPDTGDMKLGFSDSSAWALIASLIRSNCDIEEINLNVPPNKTGYVIKHLMPCGKYLYVKVMFGNGCVLGRSFHYSEKTFSTVTN